MGNNINSLFRQYNSNKIKDYQYEHTYSYNNNEIKEIKENYKIIDVDWLDPDLVNLKICTDKYFSKYPNKKEIVNNMLNYYINYENKRIYVKTDYVCNKKEKICIRNSLADEFKKIYDEKNYNKDNIYISWIKERRE